MTRALLIATALALAVPVPPEGVLWAMALFTSVGVATALGVSAGFVTAAAAFTLNVIVGSIASFALNKLVAAISGRPRTREPQFGTQLSLRTGGDIPRSIMVGRGATAGSLVWANTWGAAGGQPNAYLTQVIALSDYPARRLRRVFVNGEPVSLGPGAEYGQLDPGGMGRPVLQYRRGGTDYLWVKFYDGWQTGPDLFVANAAIHAARPWDAGRVGRGVAYAIVTARFNNDLFQGVPQCRFELDGARLYDITKDSTAGGDGPQRWDDPSTWGSEDGDGLAPVILYNLLRGLRLNGQWLYGLQGVTAAQLPAADWIAAINAARAANFRAGGEIQLNAEIGEAIEQLLAACEGRIADSAGVRYRLRLGIGGAPVAAFTDGDIISTSPQAFTPFPGLADTINGIVCSYPSPAQAWAPRSAPPLYDASLEAEDGNRRLPAQVDLPLVSNDEQVQRLMQAALREARRARRHTITLPPDYWGLEPGDVVAWTSARNGYQQKQFRVEGIVDGADLDVTVDLIEVDPSDYHWRRTTDLRPVSDGFAGIVRPTEQATVISVEPWTITSAGQPRRAGVRLNWSGAPEDAGGLSFQVRLAAEQQLVAEGRAEVVPGGSGNTIIGPLIPNTLHEVRARWRAGTPRPVAWSSWLAVMTPDVRLTAADIEAAIIAEIEAATQAAITLDGKIDGVLTDLMGEIGGLEGTVNTLSQTVGGNTAAINTLQGTKVDAAGAVAAVETEVSAQYNSLDAWATATQIAKASADQAASAFVFRAVAGAGSAELAVVAWDDETGSGGAVRVNGDLLISDASIDGGTLITPDSISGDRIIANSLTAREINVINLLAADAFIDNLNVNRLQIAGEAVGTLQMDPAAVSLAGSGSRTSAGTLFTLNFAPRAGRLTLWIDMQISIEVADGTQRAVLLMLNGAEIARVQGRILQGGSAVIDGPTSRAVTQAHVVGQGVTTISVETINIEGGDASFSVSGIGIGLLA